MASTNCRTATQDGFAPCPCCCDRGVLAKPTPLLRRRPGAANRIPKIEIGGGNGQTSAIVALELARLGQNRRPYLADELGRALIETNYRALRIGRFGIEVEHILHAGNVFAIDLRNTPHILAPRLEVILGQAPTHGLPGYAVVLGELDHRAGQQVQRPAGAAFRWARTGSCHQEGGAALRSAPPPGCKRREFAALGLVEFHPVAYIHRCLLMVEARTNS